MNKSDVFFRVTVHPVAHVLHCELSRAQQRRGLFGFHYYTSCPDCRVVDDGWELWGENQHLQGATKDRPHLTHMLRTMAQRPWRMKDGRLMGFQFRLGRKIHYRGGS